MAKDAGKIEIKKAVEEIFGVKVAKVNTLDVQRQGEAHRRRPPGMTRSWKKAYVQLAEDSKTIEFFEGMADKEECNATWLLRRLSPRPPPAVT